MDINKIMINAILTMNGKLTQSENEHNIIVIQLNSASVKPFIVFPSVSVIVTFFSFNSKLSLLCKSVFNVQIAMHAI